MKQFTLILMGLLLALPVMADPPTGMSAANTADIPSTSLSSEKELLGGEHLPLIYSDSDTLKGASATSTTHWMQIGWSPTGDIGSNGILRRFNPEVFTLNLGFDRYGAGDSVGGLASARFETAWDTTDYRSWNADSSNIFILDGNSSHPLYKIWVVEENGFAAVADSGFLDTTRFDFPLRVLRGSWLRFVFAQGTLPGDSTVVDWKLICEH